MKRAAALLLALAWPSAAAPETVAEATAALDRTEAALATAREAPDPLAALSVAIADHDAALAALRAAVTGAAAREREIALGLAERREETARLLAALQALGRNPPPEPLLHPQGPLAAARAAAMLDVVRATLRARAEALEVELAALAEARRLRVDGGRELATGLAALNEARADLREAVAAAPPLVPEPDPALETIAREADTLTALAAALADDAGDPAPAAPRPLLPPVTGPVLRGFDEPDAAGVRRPGVLMAAPPLSLVRAPADATVRYAGPFLDYGYVAVLEPAPGTLVVLAGLAQLRVSSGDEVRRGEMLGLLGGRALALEEYVMLTEGTESGAAGTLYIEIRHGSRPVDPAPWFAGENG